MKKRQVVLYIVVMLILLATSVYATVSAELNLTMKSDSEKLYAGDEFTVAIGLKGIESEKGIKSIEGYIDTDENVLEKLTIESIVTNSDGKVEVDENNILPVNVDADITSETGITFTTNPVSEKGDYKLVVNLEKAVNKDVDLITFKFKIKDDVEAGTYNSVMSYKLFKAFEDDAGEKLELESKSYKLEVSDENDSTNNTVNNVTNNTTNNGVNNTPENKPENRPENKPVNKPENKPVNKPTNKPSNGAGSVNKPGNVPTNTGKDSTLSPTDLPKTGYRLILLPIIAMAIVGFVFYKKYSKYNNYHE